MTTRAASLQAPELGSAREFSADLPAAVHEAREDRRPLSLVLLELDVPGEDSSDRGTGDRPSPAARAEAAKAALLREVGLRAYRISGRRFGVLLPGAGPDAAPVLAEAAARRMAGAGSGTPVRAGLATLQLDAGASGSLETSDALLTRADGALRGRPGTQWSLHVTP